LAADAVHLVPGAELPEDLLCGRGFGASGFLDDDDWGRGRGDSRGVSLSFLGALFFPEIEPSRKAIGVGRRAVVPLPTGRFEGLGQVVRR